MPIAAPPRPGNCGNFRTVNIDFALRHWALVGAGLLATGIILFLSYRAYIDSARGRLQATTRRLRERRKAAARARAVVERAEQKLARLRARAESIKPRRGREAKEALEDARALLKIADDQVLIAENHVRKIILEEFPPKRQAALRVRYLPEREDRDKPFTF